jgi:hypothetical protein
MIVNIKEWQYNKPTDKIDKWVFYFISDNEKIIPATTKSINNIYKYGLNVIQWAVIDFEDAEDEDTES